MSTTLARLIGKDAVLPQALADLRVTGVTADSRAVKPGFLFAALPGTQVDGVKFVPQAMAAGAVAVIARTGSDVGNAPALFHDNPNWLLAKVAARFFNKQPDTIVAVTGTNGKTSVAVFVRQIWEAMGFRAASLGTIGIVGPNGTRELGHTTPDAVGLQEAVATLADEGVEHLAIEASSHGLDQSRLAGLRLSAGGFTNLTRDHLDYHKTEDAYFEAKMKLFTELLPQGAAAVVNVDGPYGEEVALRSEAAGLRSFTVGRKGRDLRLLDLQPEGLGQLMTLKTKSGEHKVLLPLAGEFQASNALVSAGLVLGVGAEEEIVLHALSSLKGAKGRLDFVGNSSAGGAVYVDYAHTPDAIDNALRALRPVTKGKLSVVFGCGGDRDKGKRPLMAKAAAAVADVVYITDDNPRSEDPAQIRRDALVGAPQAKEIGDRATAIRAAVEAMKSGDILLVAGKGHEEGQEVKGVKRPFSDHEAVRAAIRGEDYRG